MAEPDRGAAGPWRDLIRKEHATYSAIVLLGTLLHALQVLVISVVMPTIVADLGGAVYYAWTAIIYTVGSIVGAATVEPVTRAIGRRVGYVAVAGVFMLSTAGCALSARHRDADRRARRSGVRGRAYHRRLDGN